MTRVRLLALLAVLVTVAAACGKSAPAAEVPHGEPPATASGAVTLTATGLASLPRDLVVNDASLAEALPGYTIELVPADDYSEEHFVAKLDDEVVLVIQRGAGDKLSSISVESAKIATDLGFAVGDTYAQVTKAIGELRCVDGADEGDAREAVVSCGSATYGQLGFDFIDADEEGSPRRPASEVLEDQRGLLEVKLVSVLWSPS